jgi:hypothetical protein
MNLQLLWQGSSAVLHNAAGVDEGPTLPGSGLLFLFALEGNLQPAGGAHLIHRGE